MCPESLELSAILGLAGKVLQVFGTWLLVIVGWVVVSDQTQKREIAKGYLATFTRLRDALSKIEDSATLHHLQAYEASRVRKILRDLSSLGIEVTQLVRRGLIGSGATQLVVDFRSAVTKCNFDSSSYQPQQVDSALLLDIEATKDRFDRVLLESMDIVTYRPISLLASLKGIVGR